VEEVQCELDPDQSLNDIPRKQKQAPPKPIRYFQEKFGDRKLAMAKAYLSGYFTLQEVGEGFGVSYVTVLTS